MNIIERLHEQLDGEVQDYLKFARAKGHTLQIIQTVLADGTVLPPYLSLDTRRDKNTKPRQPVASGR